jgi:adenosylcobyric acid synthase
MLPRISNFTDVDALFLEPDLDVEFVRDHRALASADVVVVPGTRATLDDLAWLRERGLADASVAHARAGKAVLGICGGFQMLGRSVQDPDGVEGPVAHAEGLGLLDVETVFVPDKVVRLSNGEALGQPVSGYEIHHGRVEAGGGVPFLDGVRDGAVFGTMWHGALESVGFRRAWLAEVAGVAGTRAPADGPGFAAMREKRIDDLADAFETYVDVPAVIRLLEEGPPRLPAIAGLSPEGQMSAKNTAPANDT